MKKGVVFILLMLTFASCSTFSRMKYGHIRKVPATPVEYSVADASIHQQEQSDSVHTAGIVATPFTDSVQRATVIADSVVETVTEDPIALVSESDFLTSCKPQTELPLRPRLHSFLPPDLQLFFAIVFIFLALIALLMCIFVIPYMAGGWVWILLAEIIMLYSAWKLIITAIAFLRGQFGKAKSYEEQ